MEIAFDEAKAAFQRGEVPVGAVILKQGQVIARDGNRVIELGDPTAHAEMMVIRSACKRLQDVRLSDCDMYVTLEPCMMCTCAVSLARIGKLYYSASNVRDGAVDTKASFFSMKLCHHVPEVYEGFMAEKSAELLRVFFSGLR